MLIHELSHLFLQAQNHLILQWEALKNAAAKKDVETEIAYPVYKVDWESELRIIPGMAELLGRHFPHMRQASILCEEAGTSGVAAKVPDHQVLDCSGSVHDLPPYVCAHYRMALTSLLDIAIGYSIDAV